MSRAIAFVIGAAVAVAASGPPAAAAPPPWIYYAGVSPSTHQSNFNKYSKLGYRMTSLDVTGGRGHPQYSAVWVQKPGPPFVAAHGKREKEMSDWITAWEKKGYRLQLLTASGDDLGLFNRAVFAGVMVKDGVQTLWKLAEPAGGLTSYYIGRRQAEGYVLTQLAPYTKDNRRARRLAFLMIKSATPPAVNHFDTDLLPAKIASTNAAAKSNLDLRPASLDPDDMGYLFHAVIWRTDYPVGAYVVKYNLTKAQLDAEMAAQKSRGYVPISLHAGGGWGVNTRYAVIFESGYITYHRYWRTTGTAVPILAAFDSYMKKFMQKNGVQNGTLAVVRDGRLALARGYTWAPYSTPLVQPTSLFRIGALTQPLTSLAALKLEQKGKLKRSDKLTSWVKLASAYHDPRMPDVTVDHLMLHASGIKRLTASYWSTAGGMHAAIAKGMLSFTPGSSYVFANENYALLGEIVDKAVPAAGYLRILTDEIFQPLSIVRPGAKTPPRYAVTYGRAPGEVRYLPPVPLAWCIDSGHCFAVAYDSRFFPPTGVYTGSHGLLMSAVDYARVLAGVFHMGKYSTVVSPAVRALMDSPVTVGLVKRYRTWQRMDGRFGVRTYEAFKDTPPPPATAVSSWGRLPGVRTVAVHQHLLTGDTSVVAMVNSEFTPSKTELLKIAAGVKTWPKADYFTTYGMPPLRPDYYVATFTATPSGSGVTLTAKVCNGGADSPAPVRLAVFADGSSPACGATPAAQATLPALKKYQCESRTFTVASPGPGTHTAWAFADSICDVPETTESNNRVSRTYVIPSATGPNLSVKSLTAKLSGNTASLALTLCHAGKTVPPYRVKLWVNASGTPSCKTPSPLIDAVLSMAEVPKDSCRTFNLAFDVTEVPSGSYTFALMTDAACAVGESSETDNVKTATLVIPKPDLSVKGFTATKSASTLTLSGMVCNAGHIAGEVGVGLYFNRATAPTCADGPDDGVLIPVLAAGACQAVTFKYDVTGAPAGTYRPWLFADALCTVPETAETNNTASSTFKLP